MSLVSGGQVSAEQAAERRFAAEAAKIAELGLSVSIMAVRKNPDWRTEHVEGTWVNRKPFGGGSFSIVVQDGEDTNGDGRIDDDEGDGNLGDSTEDSVTLLCWGEYEGIVKFAGAVVRPAPFKVEIIESPTAAGGAVGIEKR